MHSLSEDKPLKIASFKLRDAGFASAQTYAWKFIHTPQAAATKPAATAPARE